MSLKPLGDMQVPYHLDMHARRIAGQIGERHILDVDDLDRVGARPRRDRNARRLLLGVVNGVRPAHRGERVDAVDLARDLGDRRADRVGDREMMRFDRPRGPPILPLTRIEPPPTTMTGSGSGESRERSTAVSSMSAILASVRAIRPVSRWATFL